MTIPTWKWMETINKKEEEAPKTEYPSPMKPRVEAPRITRNIFGSPSVPPKQQIEQELQDRFKPKSEVIPQGEVIKLVQTRGREANKANLGIMVQNVRNISGSGRGTTFDVTRQVKGYMDITIQNRAGVGKQITEVTGFPAGSKFVLTRATGDISVIAPSPDQLAWNKYYAKQSSNLPPGLREINQFGQGLFTDVVSIVSPIAGIFGKQKEFNIMATIGMTRGSTINPFDTKEYGKNLMGGLKAGQGGIHFVTPIDYALEPIGLAPRGSTGFLNEYPAYTLGGFGGEAATLIVGNAAIEGISLGVVKSVRFTAPRMLQTFKGTFPDISSKIFSPLGKTQVGKNFSLWSRGFEPVTRGTANIIGTTFLKKGAGLDSSSYLKNIFRGSANKWYGFSEREFISPDMMKNLLKPSAEITMAARTTGFEFTIERTSYKGARRIYEELRVVSRPGKTVFETGGDILGPRKGIGEYYGSFYNVAPSTRGILASELALENPKVAWLYNVVRPSQQGVGIPYIRSIPQGFVKNTGASASILRQIEVPVSRSVTSGLTKGLSTGGLSVFTPIETHLGGLLGELGSYLFLRGASSKTKTIPQYETYLRTDTNTRSMLKTIQSPVLDIGRIMGSISITGQKTKQLSLTAQDYDVMSITAVDTKLVSLTMPGYGTTPNIPIIPIFPGIGSTFGGGGGYGSRKRRKKGSRYRVHPVELYNVLYLNKRISI